MDLAAKKIENETDSKSRKNDLFDQSHFSAIVESSDDAIYSKTLAGIVTSWNPAAERLYGYLKDEIVGQHVSILASEKDQIQIEEILDKVRQGIKIDHFETTRYRKDKQMMNVSLTVSPVRDEYGIITGASVIARDITEQKKAERLLKEHERALEISEQRFRSLITHSTDGIVLLDQYAIITYASPAIKTILGYQIEEFVGRQAFELMHPDDKGPVYEIFTRLLDKPAGEVSKAQYRYLHKNGTWRWIEAHGNNLLSDDAVKAIVVNYRDITEAKDAAQALESNERLFRALIENSSDAIGLIDVTGKILYLSSTTERILGYKPEELMGTNGFDLVFPEDIDLAQRSFATILNSMGKSATFEVRVKNKNMGYRWVECVVNNLLDDPHIKAIVANFRDVHDRAVAEEQRNIAQSKMEYTFLHDGLTDLPNRVYFNERLIQAIITSKLRAGMSAVILIDLDRFKLINESLGHAIGDRLLQEVSLRLRSCLEEGEILSRLGGDEFGILLPDLKREDVAGKVCQKILEALKHPFRLDYHELFVTPSLGISLYPTDAEDASILMRNADAALYIAKEQGRNNFQYYSPAMNAKSFERLSLENTLRKALQNNEFLVYYQPQIEIATGKIVALEALIRWQHPDLGLTFPEEFIGLAEATGLIEPIGEWVLRDSMMQVKKWHDLGFSDLRLSVNISARQFRQKHLVRIIHRHLDETGFPATKLELELTESAVIENSPVVSNILNELKRDGIKFAMDDFNTGHSSLKYIKMLPIDILKIDRWGIKNIPIKEKDTAIANSIINLAHSLNMTAVAEGVDKPEQLEFLKQQKCDLVQGFLFSPPVEASKITELLEKNRNWPNTL